MLEKIIKIIFPPTCGFCEKYSENYICKKCELQIEKYKKEIIETYIKDKKKHFDYHINFFKYEGRIRNLIINYKFNEKSYLYKTFSEIILKNKKICGILKKYDIIIPVPISNNKRIERSYNQTELIAKKVAKDLNIACSDRVLIKKNNIKTQSSLTKAQRQKNVLGAFYIKNSKFIDNKNVILLDDVYTTGSTVNECSKVLKASGAKKIIVLTIAKD